MLVQKSLEQQSSSKKKKSPQLVYGSFRKNKADSVGRSHSVLSFFTGKNPPVVRHVAIISERGDSHRIPTPVEHTLSEPFSSAWLHSVL